MSLSSIMNIGLSGLQASQQGLRVASQNVANAGTPGYARADLALAPSTVGGVGAGVQVSDIRSAADRFLQATSRSAQAGASAAQSRATFLDRAQAIFGDPGSDGSTLGGVNRVFSAFEALALDPTSAARRGSAITELQTAFADISRAASDLEQLRLEADARLADHVSAVNGLLGRISSLNGEIAAVRAGGGDATSAENLQAQAIDDLSKLMEVQLNPREQGGVEIRSARGLILVGESGPAVLSYQANSAPYQPPGEILMLDPGGIARPLLGEFQSGEIAGLIQVRDKDIPALSEELGALAAALADALNAAHNGSASTTPQANLTGRQTGLSDNDALSFTGVAQFGVVDLQGALLRRISVDFSAATISVNGDPAQAIASAVPGQPTIGEFEAALDAALSGAIGPDPADLGSASFAQGRFTLSAQGSGAGVVIAQDTANPSDRAGRGFSHFFGLNDLITRPTPSFFDSGLSGTAEGFAGDPVVFRIRDDSGRVVAERSIAAVAGSLNGMIAAVNAVGTGIGPYGAFSNPSVQGGEVSLTMAQGYRLEVVSDGSDRAGTGVSFSELFGIGPSVTASRARELALRSDISADPARLATARPDLTGTIGARVLEAGDQRGAQALAAARTDSRRIPAAGALPEQTISIDRYTALVAGDIGRRAADAERTAQSSQAVLTAAQERRSSQEGVNLDDELVKMTRYQQSYQAAARLIQAAQDMWDVLLSIR